MGLFDFMKKKPDAQPVRYTLRRMDYTGGIEYDMYCGERRFAAARNDCIPGFPLSLGCLGDSLSLQSRFDETIMPGAFRKVTDRNGQLYAAAVYLRPGNHVLQTAENDDIQVTTAPDFLQFRKGDKLLAELRIFPDRVDRYVMTAKEPLPDRLAMLMLCFPILQIGR